jgi:hypothetical protein
VVSASFVLLLTFAALAPLDGLYLHLWRYRLHARAESRREHALHTARALLFPVILVLLYGGSSSGWPLLLGAVLVAADVAIQAADMWVEPASRAGLGGLSSFESVLHGVLITIGSASLALMLGSRPVSAWSLAAAPTLGPSHGPFAEQVVGMLLPGAVLIAGLHLYLWLRPASLIEEGARS